MSHSRLTDLDFAFIDAIINRDYELALRIAYEYEQGEQISLF